MHRKIFYTWTLKITFPVIWADGFHKFTDQKIHGFMRVFCYNVVSTIKLDQTVIPTFIISRTNKLLLIRIHADIVEILDVHVI